MRPLSILLVVAVSSTATAQTMITVSAGGMSFQVDRYLPAGAGPFPVVALGHGFSNSKDNVRALALALQADGIAVVAPQLTGGLGINHSLNADALVAAVDAVVTAGQGDATRVAFGGHSAGGLAAWLAASRRTTARALVLLDPVDASGLGAAQTANVVAPTLFEFAPPQTCNTQNNTLGWFTGKQGLKGRFQVPMANHCDPQDPVNSLCLGGCGPTFLQPATWNMARSAVFGRYARAFFRQFLLEDRSTCVEAMATADAMAGTISEVTMQLGSCASDGGSPAGGGAAGGAAGGGAVGGGAAGGAAAGGSAAGGNAAGGNAAGGNAAGGTTSGGGAAGGSAASGGVGGGPAAGGAAGSSGGSAVQRCDATTCSGCCNGTVCVPASAMTCGVNGSACAICLGDQVCDVGRCVAPPTTGCGCTSLEAPALVLLALLLVRRR